jgi:hypothetical protein
MQHIKDATKWCEQSISIENRSLLQLNIRSTNHFFSMLLGSVRCFIISCIYLWKSNTSCINSQSNGMSEILKCVSVVTKIETSGRSKIHWITSKIEMIGILKKFFSRQYVPRICPFRYWYELHNVWMSNDFEDELFCSDLPLLAAAWTVRSLAYFLNSWGWTASLIVGVV